MNQCNFRSFGYAIQAAIVCFALSVSVASAADDSPLIIKEQGSFAAGGTVTTEAQQAFEHAREQMGKKLATRAGANLLSAVLGLGNVGNTLLDMGTQVAALKFSRSDESEADIVGMDLAARAGYDPRAGVALWNKMLQASKGAPAEFLSTHPSGTTRIADIEARLPKVLPLYEAAAKPERRFGPPPLPPARKTG